MTNNTPDPDVAAWMKSMGYELDSFGCWWRLHPSGNFYEYLSKGQAAFFYHAQQRAVLEVLKKIGKNTSIYDRAGYIADMIVELEAQLRNNKEGKL